MKTIFTLFMALLLTLGILSVSYSGHKEEKGMIKGSVTRIEVTEYEFTVKDDKGKETKVKVKDAADIKVGDSVVIKDGKATKQVKPLTGGY
ncbi:MAG: hypothetical protein EPN94_06450 [Nitrospirae bacterium]|nr:MAG: hypothetical protein EPN94_06450 [Nitrospirota bacterium]